MAQARKRVVGARLAHLGAFLVLLALIVSIGLANAAQTHSKRAEARPDLVVRSLSGVPQQLAPGESFAVDAKVKNKGSRKSKRSKLSFHLSVDEEHSGDDLALDGKEKVKRLKPGKKKKLSAELAVPQAASGPLYLIACVKKVKGEKGKAKKNNCRAGSAITVRPITVVGAPEPAPEPAPPPGPEPEPIEDDWSELGSAGVVTLSGVSPDTFNALDSTVRYDIADAALITQPGGVIVTVNGAPVPDSLVTVTEHSVTVSGALSDGRNELLLMASDTAGLPLEHHAVVWAGDITLETVTVDENDQPEPGATVRARLGDDQNVTSQGVAGPDGRVTFENVPGRSVSLEATADGNRMATTAVAAVSGMPPVTLKLEGFNQPSDVDNNDFSQGADGWNLPAPDHWELVPHNEGPVEPAAAVKAASSRAAGDAEAAAPANAAAAKAEDMDLMLDTGGVEGPVSLSRTFEIEEGFEAVTVRYRFITSEVPGGYFGTEYNDYFRVSIRSQTAGGSVQESNSMNGLGLGAFDAGGATAWREQELAVDEKSDTIQVDVTVANVSDDLLDSQVVVDIVKKKKLRVSELSLNDINNPPPGAALEYLSTSDHPWFGGNTRIFGTITIEGDKDLEVDNVELEVLEGGAVRARAQLAPGLDGVLYQKLGDDETVAVTANQRLFDLPAAQAALVDQLNNGTVTLRAKVETTGDEEDDEEYATPPQKLVRHRAAPRYLCCNENEGGDEWVKPRVKPVLEGIGATTWGDASNMNGGRIPPHDTHQTGNDLDGIFAGYCNPCGPPNVVPNANERITAAAAQGLIDRINEAEAALDDDSPNRVAQVLATYCRPGFAAVCAFDNSMAFWDQIRDSDPATPGNQPVLLDDGRPAQNVIVPRLRHADHFHMRFTDG